MVAAIQTYTAVRKSGRGYLVFGDMLELGEQAETLHRHIGVVAGEAGAVRLYAHGDHAASLAAGARKAGMKDEAVMTGTKEAIAADLVGQLQPEDWLLVKGSRGMAMETVVKAVLQWAQGPLTG